MTLVGEFQGRKVAITGRLASMTREEAAELIRARGGELVGKPGRSTRYLVVGQEGWPLREDGQLTRSLEKAQDLREAGHSLEIIDETQFLVELGLEERHVQIHRLYTTAQLSRILGTTGARLRTWVRQGLITPARTVHRLDYFDFQQVAAAKALSELAASGVTSERMRRSLEQLRHWLPEAEQSLSQVAILERGGQLLVRLGDGQLVDPRGQLQLDFAATESSDVRQLPQ
ncbi:MAG: MerR family transcriptional regulator, partial [Planctomycetota bacterium]